MKIVTLLSGGPDSSTLLYWAKSQGHEQRALFVDTGQSYSEYELAGARAVADAAGTPLEVADVSGFRRVLLGYIDPPYTSMGGDAEVWRKGGAFVPLGIACSYAVLTGAEQVLLAVIREDVEAWPDMPTFLSNSVPNFKLISGNGQARIETPFSDRWKHEVLTLGAELGVPFHKTRTCQAPTPHHCGVCARCLMRKDAFVESGVDDKTEYEA